MITPDLVRFLFDYQDGVLIWRADRGGRAHAGMVAGSMNNGQHAIRIDGVRYMRSRLVWAWWHSAWPEHRVFHRNYITTDDAIDNLLDLTYPQVRQLQRPMQRDLPTGVMPARHGYNFVARLDDQYLGSFKTAKEAGDAHFKAHVSKYGSTSSYATGIANHARGANYVA